VLVFAPESGLELGLELGPEHELVDARVLAVALTPELELVLMPKPEPVLVPVGAGPRTLAERSKARSDVSDP